MKKIILVVVYIVIIISCNHNVTEYKVDSYINRESADINYKISFTKVDSLFLPQEYILNQNYPNPFEKRTAFQFSLPAQTFVEFIMLDSFNNEVANLIAKELMPGTYSLVFSSDEIPNGLYYYEINAGEFNEVKEMLVIKKY